MTAMVDSACIDFHRSQPTRRQLLQVGGAGLLGLSLPQFLRAADAARGKGRARSVIFLHQWGGPSHHDTFDMKPHAPDAIRGEYTPVASSLPGLTVCEHLPRTAKVMHKVTLVRGLCHTMKNHNSAGYYSLTGRAPPSDD